MTRHGLARPRRQWCLCLAGALLFAVSAGQAAPQREAEFVGGLFWFTDKADSYEFGDVQPDLRQRNPLAVGNRLMLRALSSAGRYSSVYVYDLDAVMKQLPEWTAGPLAVSPPWESVVGQTGASGFSAKPERVTSLYRGPGYGALLQDQTSLWTLAGRDFKRSPQPGFVKGLVGTGQDQALATEDRVRVGTQVWFECAKTGTCKAVVNLGLDWVPQARVLAVGYADADEGRHVCVQHAPGQACNPGSQGAPGNRVPGRQPLLSEHGNYLAVAVAGDSAAGAAGTEETWVIQVYAVGDAGGVPSLTPAWRSDPIRLYARHGAGGDHLDYNGSYAWSQDRLYFLPVAGMNRDRGTAPRVSVWSSGQGPQSIALPAQVRTANPFFCTTPISAPAGPPHALRLVWAPPPGGACAGSGELSDTRYFEYSLLEVFAVAPMRLDTDPGSRDLIAVQVVIRGDLMTEHVSGRTLERLLLFRVP